MMKKLINGIYVVFFLMLFCFSANATCFWEIATCPTDQELLIGYCVNADANSTNPCNNCGTTSRCYGTIE